eukprot:Pgem_evm1s13576
MATLVELQKCWKNTPSFNSEVSNVYYDQVDVLTRILRARSSIRAIINCNKEMAGFTQELANALIGIVPRHP